MVENNLFASNTPLEHEKKFVVIVFFAKYFLFFNSYFRQQSKCVMHISEMLAGFRDSNPI